MTNRLPTTELWTPELVGARLIQAFKTLKRTPVQMYPRGFHGQGYWPAYTHDFSDIREWADEWRAGAMDGWARIRHSPSPVEITEMDEAIGWPAEFLKHTPNDCRNVLIWATAKADGRKVKPIIERKNWVRSSYYKSVRRGLAIVASNLNRFES